MLDEHQEIQEEEFHAKVLGISVTLVRPQILGRRLDGQFRRVIETPQKREKRKIDLVREEANIEV